MVDAATSFRKNGFNDEDAAQLGQIAATYQNIADEAVSASDAADMIIAQMIAFNIPAEQAITIIDSINEVSNSFSVSSADLATNLGKVAATSATMGNTMSETIAMMTGITEQTRNASTAARGLNSLFAQLSLTLNENSSVGKELKRIYADLGISLTDDVTGQMRDTYNILSDLALQWKDLSINQQRYIAEASAGKTQLNNFMALMNNFDHVLEANETALNSAGSAANENAKYMEGLQASLSQLKSEFQDFATAVVSSDMVNSVLSIAKAFLTLANTPFGQFITQTTLVTGAIYGLTSKIVALDIIKNVGGNFKNLITVFKGVASGASLASVGITGLSGAISVLLPVVAGIVVAVQAGIAIFDAMTVSLEEQKQVVDDLTNSIKNLSAERDELANKTNLTQAEQQQLDLLNKQIAANEILLEQEKEKQYRKQFGEESQIRNPFTSEWWTTDTDQLSMTGQERLLDDIEQAEKYRKQIAKLEEDILELDATQEENAETIQTLTKRKEALEDALVDLDGRIQSTGNEYLDLTEGMKDSEGIIESTRQKYLDYLDSVIQTANAEEEASAAVEASSLSIENYQELVDNMSMSLENLQEIYNTLNDVVETYNTTGSITADQLSTLISYGSEYIDMLSLENGKLVLNEEALYNKSIQLRQSALEEAKATAASQLYAIANDGVKTAIDNAAEAAGATPESFAPFVEILGQVGENAISAAAGVSALAASTGQSFTEEQTAAMESVLNNYNKVVELINSTNFSFGGLSGSTTSGGSSSGTAKDPIEEQNKIFQEQLSILEDRLSLLQESDAPIEEQIELLKQMQDTVHEQAEWYRSQGLDENSEYLRELGIQWWEYYNQIIELQKEALDDQLGLLDDRAWFIEQNLAQEEDLNEQTLQDYISLQNQRVEIFRQAQEKIHALAEAYRAQGLEEDSEQLRELGKLWWDYENQINDVNQNIADNQERVWEEAMQAQIDAIQSQVDVYEKLFSYISNQIDKEIEKLQEQRDKEEEYWDAKIEALEEQNDEIERQIQLEQLQQNLAAAEQQRLLVFKDGRFQYVQNVEAINEAQTELEAFEREEALRQEVENLEKLKEQALASIDEQIKGWEEYKEQWSSVVDHYQEEQDRLLLEQELGIELEGELWKERLENLETYISQYESLMDRLSAAQNQLNSGFGGSGSISGGIGGILGGGGGSTGSGGISMGDDWLNGQSFSEWLSQHDAPTNVIISEIMKESGMDYDDAVDYYNKHYGSSGGSSGSSDDSGYDDYEDDSDSDYSPGGVTNPDGSWSPFPGGPVYKNAKGTLSSHGGLSLVGEEGPELRVLNQGDGIIPASATKNLMELSKYSFKDLMGGLGQSVYSYMFDKLVLPNVTDAKSFINELKRFKQYAYQQ